MLLEHFSFGQISVPDRLRVNLSVLFDQILPERNSEARALRHFNRAVLFQDGRVFEDLPALEDIRMRRFVDELCYRTVWHGRNKVDSADID